MATQNTNTNTTPSTKINAILYFKDRANKIVTFKDGCYETTLKSYTLVEDEKTPRIALELTLNGTKYTRTIFDVEFLALCRELQRNSDTQESNPFDTIEKVIKNKTKFNVWLQTVTVETQKGWAERQNWLYKEPVVAPKEESTESKLSDDDKKLLAKLDKII